MSFITQVRGFVANGELVTVTPVTGFAYKGHIAEVGNDYLRLETGPESECFINPAHIVSVNVKRVSA